MKKIALFLLIALCVQSSINAKNKKKESQGNTFTISKELKGFEVDYLTNKDFKTKVENKKFWGILEIIIDWVASLFNSSYGKYTDDTKNQDGPYFLFDRSPNGLPISEQLQQLRNKIMGKDATNTIIASNNYDSIYKTILDNATNNTPSNCNKFSVCEGAAIAKNAAFVYIVGIGLNLDGNFEYFTDINLRNGYRDKAINYLKNLEGFCLRLVFSPTFFLLKL